MAFANSWNCRLLSWTAAEWPPMAPSAAVKWNIGFLASWAIGIRLLKCLSIASSLSSSSTVAVVAVSPSTSFAYVGGIRFAHFKYDFTGRFSRTDGFNNT